MTNEMMFRIRYYRDDSKVNNHKGEPTTDSIYSIPMPMFDLVEHLMHTVRRLELREAPLTYVSIEFAESFKELP